MNLRTTYRPLGAMALALLLIPLAAAAPAEDDPAGTRQYAAAVALHNRELYDLAADEWVKFVKDYPKHSRAAHGQHYLGICYFKTGQLDKARGAFETVIARYPKFPLLETSYLYLGITQFSQAQAGKSDQFAAAAATFATQLEKYAKGKHAAQALYYRGECFYSQNKKAEAAELYRQLVEGYPNHALVADALYALGVAQEELRRHEEAGETYTQFLKRFAEHPLAVEVEMRYGETLFARKQYAEAERRFAAAAAAKGFRLADHALMRQAASLAARSQFKSAAALYAELGERFPESDYVATAQLEGGKCAFLAGDFDASRKLLADLSSAGGETGAEAAHWIARGYLKQGKATEALAAAEAGLRGGSETAHAAQLLLDKADALYELPSRRKESVRAYADLASRFPEDPAAAQALYMAGYASLNVGDHAAALRYCEAFLKAHPESNLAADVGYVAAESQLQLKQYPEAEKQYRGLLKAHPQHAEIAMWRVRLALTLHLEGKYAEVIRETQPHLAALRDPALRAEAYYLLGSSQNQLGQDKDAVAALEASLEADDQWRQADETLLALAGALKATGRDDDARRRLRQLVENFPNSRVLDRAHYRLADYAYDAGDYGPAAAGYQKVIADWPQSSLVPHALYGLGWTQLGQKQYAAAEKTLTTLIERADDGPAAVRKLAPRARYGRGLARQQEKKYAEAATDLEAFLAAEPGAAEASDARYVLAMCRVGQGEPADAVGSLRAILKDDPDYAGADKVRYELAWALKALKKDEEAADEFAALAERHPESPLAAESLYHVAEGLYDAKKYQEAAKKYYAAEQRAGELGRSGQLKPDVAARLGEKAAHKLGWCYYRRDDFDSASKTFDYQLKTYPEGDLLSDARFMQAESLFRRDQYKEALAAYRALREPSSDEFAALAALHGAQSANQLMQYDVAQQLVADFAKRFPDSELAPEAKYEQGWALHNQDKLDEAARLYEEITAETNREVAAKARFMIGDIHFRRKQHAEAVKHYFRVAYGYGYEVWQSNALFEAARCLEVLGKKEAARKSYQEIIDKFPESEKAPLAKQRLEALNG